MYDACTCVELALMYFHGNTMRLSFFCVFVVPLYVPLCSCVVRKIRKLEIALIRASTFFFFFFLLVRCAKRAKTTLCFLIYPFCQAYCIVRYTSYPGSTFLTLCHTQRKIAVIFFVLVLFFQASRGGGVSVLPGEVAAMRRQRLVKVRRGAWGGLLCSEECVRVINSFLVFSAYEIVASARTRV